MFAIYYNYGLYKLSSDNNDALSQMHRIISSAKDADYNCKNEQIPGISAYREILSRRRNISTSHSYIISDCVQLPTGEIFLSLNNGNTRYYVLLKVNENNPKSHYILDIRGEVMG